MRFIAAMVLAGVLGLGSAAAHEFKVGEIEILHPWVRVPPPGAGTAGGYLTIINKGSEADRLLSVSSDVAGLAQIHDMSIENGVMKMGELADGIEIPPGATLELKPKSLHIMFMDLTRPIRVDTPIRGELRFEKAGNVAVEFAVEPMGASEPEPMEDHDMSEGTTP